MGLEHIETIGPSVSAVDDDGQLGGVGELHLVTKDALLDVAGGVIVEIIEADFAEGDHFGMLREPGQSV